MIMFNPGSYSAKQELKREALEKICGTYGPQSYECQGTFGVYRGEQKINDSRNTFDIYMGGLYLVLLFGIALFVIKSLYHQFHHTTTN